MSNKIFEGTKNIKREDLSLLKINIDNFLKGIFNGNLDLFRRYIGSSLIKKEIYGDIDVALNFTNISDNKLKIFQLFQEIIKYSKIEDCKYIKGLDIISLKFPMNEDFCQVDFILTDNLDFSEFYYHSSKNSKFKNSYRNILLSALIKYFDQQFFDNGKFETRLMLTGKNGLEFVKKSYVGKNKEKIKQGKIIKRIIISKNPEYIKNYILGPHAHLKDLDSLESLLKFITNKDWWNRENLDKIIEETKNGIKKCGLTSFDFSLQI